MDYPRLGLERVRGGLCRYSPPPKKKIRTCILGSVADCRSAVGHLSPADQLPVADHFLVACRMCSADCMSPAGLRSLPAAYYRPASSCRRLVVRCHLTLAPSLDPSLLSFGSSLASGWPCQVASDALVILFFCLRPYLSVIFPWNSA